MTTLSTKSTNRSDVSPAPWKIVTENRFGDGVPGVPCHHVLTAALAHRSPLLGRYVTEVSNRSCDVMGRDFRQDDTGAHLLDKRELR